jgi:hypothetical protein
MHKTVLALPVLFALSLVTVDARADYMRCGRDLISEGDHQGEVLAACGEPLLAREQKIYRSGIPRRYFGTQSLGIGNRYYSDLTNRELAYHNRSVVEVQVETWTYNFGPHYFMREVTFQDGKIINIETLGYGH